MSRSDEENLKSMTILVVEDNIGMRRLIQKRLERERFIVSVAESGTEAISLLKNNPNQILLLDYKLPDMNGKELITNLVQEGFSIPFVIMTGHGDERIAVEMMKLGARDYLVKDHALIEVLPQIMEQVFIQVLTEKKLSEVRKALKESEERFKMLFNRGSDAIFVIELNNGKPGHFIEVNDIACNRLEYTREELSQMSLKDIEIPEEAIFHIYEQDTLTERKSILYEAVQIKKNSDRINVENNSHIIDLGGNPAILCISRDISQRKQLEGQLRQAQKMEAIGKLAGGVAHDFNNLLTAIMGYSELLLVKMDAQNPFRDILKEIKRAGDRAASLTQQLLAFSRKQMLKPQIVDLNRVVTGMEKMLKRIIGEDVHLISNLDPSLYRIKADPGNIEQIILNLAVNAVDAMPQGGNLTLKTENIVVDEQYTIQDPMARPGNFVRLTISDNGSGMEKKIIPFIFEPFFTTKKTGTGLGLSVVYGIIKQHNGWINVLSEPQEGSIFNIFFPAITIEEVQITEESITLEDYSGNGERILLVEDEEGVMNVALKVLRDYGYQVIGAASYQEGLNIYNREDRNFQLIVSDIVLPDRSGIELTEYILSVDPTIKILLTSGYADQRSHWTEVVKKGIPFLQKPYTLGDLLKQVKEVLEPPK